MKKMIVMAAVALMSLGANAQNPDALKEVMRAEDFKVANELMKAQGESMTAQERAKGYNKLVDLALAKVQKEQKKYNEYEAKILQDYDPNKYWKQCAAAVKAARDCDKADKEPNEKGQVKPKYRKNNQERVMAARQALVQGGLDMYNNKDFKQSVKYFGAFVESRNDGLYEGYDFKNETNYPQIAYYASLAAYFAEDYKKGVKYATYALESGDKEVENDALKIYTGSLDKQKEKGEIDNEQMASKVRKLYKMFPDNEVVFSKLYAVYDEAGDKENAQKLLDKRLKANPNDAIALAYIAQNAQTAGDFDTAIQSYQKVLEARPDFVAVKFNLCVCYLNKATSAIEKNTDNRGVLKADAKPQIQADLQKAKATMDEIKAADPNKEQVNWAYTAERIDYAIDNVK